MARISCLQPRVGPGSGPGIARRREGAGLTPKTVRPDAGPPAAGHPGPRRAAGPAGPPRPGPPRCSRWQDMQEPRSWLRAPVAASLSFAWAAFSSSAVLAAQAATSASPTTPSTREGGRTWRGRPPRASTRRPRPGSSPRGEGPATGPWRASRSASSARGSGGPSCAGCSAPSSRRPRPAARRSPPRPSDSPGPRPRPTRSRRGAGRRRTAGRRATSPGRIGMDIVITHLVRVTRPGGTTTTRGPARPRTGRRGPPYFVSARASPGWNGPRNSRPSPRRRRARTSLSRRPRRGKDRPAVGADHLADRPLRLRWHRRIV